MAEKIGKCGWITKQVVKLAKDGLSMKEIFACLEEDHDYQKLPQSLATFRRYYYDDFLKARGSQVAAVGNKLIEAALEGDYKSQELFLTTHSEAWMKKSTLEVAEVEDVDEERSALNGLLDALGIDTEEDDNEEGHSKA